jgi:hypothetical protein
LGALLVWYGCRKITSFRKKIGQSGEKSEVEKKAELTDLNWFYSLIYLEL